MKAAALGEGTMGLSVATVLVIFLVPHLADPAQLLLPRV